jgi:hypothetical protein
VVEQRLLRLIGEQPGDVPVALISWLVTGQWPQPKMCCDVVRAGAELPEF